MQVSDLLNGFAKKENMYFIKSMFYLPDVFNYLDLTGVLVSFIINPSQFYLIDQTRIICSSGCSGCLELIYTYF